MIRHPDSYLYLIVLFIGINVIPFNTTLTVNASSHQCDKIASQLDLPTTAIFRSGPRSTDFSCEFSLGSDQDNRLRTVEDVHIALKGFFRVGTNRDYYQTNAATLKQQEKEGVKLFETSFAPGEQAVISHITRHGEYIWPDSDTLFGLSELYFTQGRCLGIAEFEANGSALADEPRSLLDQYHLEIDEDYNITYIDPHPGFDHSLPEEMVAEAEKFGRKLAAAMQDVCGGGEVDKDSQSAENKTTKQTANIPWTWKYFDKDFYDNPEYRESLDRLWDSLDEFFQVDKPLVRTVSYDGPSWWTDAYRPSFLLDLPSATDAWITTDENDIWHLDLNTLTDIEPPAADFLKQVGNSTGFYFTDLSKSTFRVNDWPIARADYGIVSLSPDFLDTFGSKGPLNYTFHPDSLVPADTWVDIHSTNFDLNIGSNTGIIGDNSFQINAIELKPGVVRVKSKVSSEKSKMADTYHGLSQGQPVYLNTSTTKVVDLPNIQILSTDSDFAFAHDRDAGVSAAEFYNGVFMVKNKHNGEYGVIYTQYDKPIPYIEISNNGTTHKKIAVPRSVLAAGAGTL